MLVLVAALASYALADCMSGVMAAEALMPCCQVAQHDCPTMPDGRSCCPEVNRAGQEFSAVKAGAAPELRADAAALLMVSPAFVPPLLSSARLGPTTDPSRHVPPNILTSALADLEPALDRQRAATWFAARVCLRVPISVLEAVLVSIICRRLSFALIAVIGFTVPARSAVAQQSPDIDRPPLYDGPALSLQTAIDQALDRNPELIALRKEFEASRYRPAQEHSLPPPMFEAQIWQWPINSFNPANTNMYMFMVNQELPGRGKRTLRAAAAEADVAMSGNDIAVRARQLVGEVKGAYAEVFVARRAIDIFSDNLSLLRQMADVSQAKYSTGRISQQDVLKPVVELSMIHDQIITFGERRDIATARLNTLLDRPPDAPIGALAEPREQAALPSADALQRLAFERQPELKGTELAIDKARADLAVVKQEYKPDFSVQAGYMLTPRDTDAVMARVGISWPNAPWARGGIAARVSEATAAVAAADARRQATVNAVRLAVQEGYIRVQSAQRHASLLRTTIVPQSQQTLDVSRVAYQTDRVDFLALIDNQRVLLEAQLEYVRALSDIEQAFADLERAVGAELPTGTLSGRIEVIR